MKVFSKHNRGFTIIELLVVLTIAIGVVVALTRGVVSGREAANIKRAQIIIEGQLKTAIVAYCSAKSPTAKKGEVETALKTLAGKTDAKDLATELGIKEDMLTDPWGTTYKITGTDTEATITDGNTPARVTTKFDVMDLM